MRIKLRDQKSYTVQFQRIANRYFLLLKYFDPFQLYGVQRERHAARTPEGIAKIELLLPGKLRDGSAPQLISVSLANSILFTPREETTVRAVTVNRA